MRHRAVNLSSSKCIASRHAFDPAKNARRHALFGLISRTAARGGNTKTVNEDRRLVRCVMPGGEHEGLACGSMAGSGRRRLSDIGVAIHRGTATADGFGKQVRGSDWQDCPTARRLLDGHGHGVRRQGSPRHLPADDARSNTSIERFKPMPRANAGTRTPFDWCSNAIRP